MEDAYNTRSVSTLKQWHKQESSRITDTGLFHTLLADRYALRHTLAALARGYVGGRVLDAGAGTSPYRQLFDGAVQGYVSLDITSENGSTQCVGSMDAMPLRDEAFDCVLCTQVLEHVKDPPRTLREMRRTLVAGGYLVLTAPHLSRLHNEPRDYYRYTEHGLKHLLASAELEPVTVVAAGGILSFLHTQLATLTLGPCSRTVILRPVWRALSHLGARACVWLDRKLGTERFFPLNYVAVARKRCGTRPDR